MEKQRIKIKVTGIVQGVGFRYFTQRSACSLGICGFVENLEDGSVVIEGEGDKERLEQFVRVINRGPQWAKVENIETDNMPAKGDETFRVK